MNPLQMVNGYKTYISIAAYAIYVISVGHGWIPVIPDVETFLKAAIGASLAHKIAKLGDPAAQ